MKQNINYSEKTDYNIEYFTLFNNFLAFKAQIISSNIFSKKETVFEGIGLKDEINDKKMNFKCLYKPYKKEVLEVINKNLFNPELYEDFFIENPFSYIENNSSKNIILLKIDTYERKIYDHSREVPTAFLFDNINGCITSKKYNLNTILKTLSKRDDVVIINNSLCNPIFTFKKSDTESYDYIKFLWLPTVTKYKEIRDKTSIYEINKYILKNILKIEIAC